MAAGAVAAAAHRRAHRRERKTKGAVAVTNVTVESPGRTSALASGKPRTSLGRLTMETVRGAQASKLGGLDRV